MRSACRDIWQMRIYIDLLGKTYLNACIFAGRKWHNITICAIFIRKKLIKRGLISVSFKALTT